MFIDGFFLMLGMLGALWFVASFFSSSMDDYDEYIESSKSIQIKKTEWSSSDFKKITYTALSCGAVYIIGIILVKIFL